MTNRVPSPIDVHNGISISAAERRELDESTEYWLKVARSTAPLDKAAATEAICTFYEAIDRKRPEVLFLRSPAACIGAADALREDVNWKPLDALQLRSSLCVELESQLWTQLPSHTWWWLKSQTWSTLDSQIWSPLWAQLWAQLRSQRASQSDNCFGGGWWCSWAMFYEYCQRIGINYTQRQKSLLQLWMLQSRHCHWWFGFEGLVLASERPVTLCVDHRGRLHSVSGASLEYADGEVLYSWHGVRVNRGVIDNPNALTARQIADEENAEIRRVMVVRMGYEKYLREAEAAIVHRDKRGRLWSVGRKDDTDLRLVEVVNSTPEPDGSVKTHLLRVPPTMQTATEAVAWTFGMSRVQYRPDVES